MTDIERRLVELEQRISDLERPKGEIMDAKQLSERVFLGAISPWCIYQFVKAKGMPHIKDGRRILFYRNEVVEWMAKQQQTNRPLRRVN